MNHNAIYLFLLFFMSVSVFGQATEIKKKRSLNNKNEKAGSPQFTNDKIEFKNETGSAILIITDEGNNTGSIELREMSSAPSVPSNKIYNENGTLKFNGGLIGSSGAASIDELSDGKFDGSSLFIGEGAGINDDGSTNQNTSVGFNTLKLNTTGHSNSALGFDALTSNVSGAENTAFGFNALRSNNTGYSNTGVGYQALDKNTGGYENTANGYFALNSNTSGNQNTATGYQALKVNTDGNQNTAVGYQALLTNNSGDENSAFGFGALNQNTSGSKNTAIGYQALSGNGSGSYNTAVGYLAGVDNNSLTNTTAIGHLAKTTTNNQIRIGNSDVDDIGGQVGFSALSDGRFKNNIKQDVAGLDFIMGLKPVSYNLDIEAVALKLNENSSVVENGNINSAARNPDLEVNRKLRTDKRETGFIAQDVESLIKELGIDFNGVVIPKNDESLYALRYANFVVPIVKAMQEQQAIIERMQKEINDLRKNASN